MSSDLSELISAKAAMHMLSIHDRATFRKFVGSNPAVKCILAGLNRPRYRRGVLLKLLQPAV